MKGYVEQALKELEHELSSHRHQAAPSNVVRPDYGAKIQYAHNDDGAPVDNDQISRIQRTLGTFLYYARADEFPLALGGDLSRNYFKYDWKWKKVTGYR